MNKKNIVSSWIGEKSIEKQPSYICGKCGAEIPIEVFTHMENRGLSMKFCPCCGARMIIYLPDEMDAEDYLKIKQLLDIAEKYTTNPPIKGENGNYWIWDDSIKTYIDSHVSASIKAVERGNYDK